MRFDLSVALGRRLAHWDNTPQTRRKKTYHSLAVVRSSLYHRDRSGVDSLVFCAGMAFQWIESNEARYISIAVNLIIRSCLPLTTFMSQQGLLGRMVFLLIFFDVLLIFCVYCVFFKLGTNTPKSLLNLKIAEWIVHGTRCRLGFGVQIFFIFTPTWGNESNLTSIFFNWVETTN